MEAVATGGAARISSEAAKGIFQEAKRHIRYVIFYQRYVKNFEDKLQKLIEKRSSVQQDIVVAERNVEKIKPDVQGWCDRVDKVIVEEEDKVKDLQVKAKNKCFFGVCPSIKSRYRLSSKAEEDATTFDDLIKECQFDRVGYRDVPEATVHTEFVTFDSRKKVFNDIIESLKDSTINMIGVYGMPGVGKTSLVKEVERQLQEIKLFSSVVTTIVSRSPNVLKIQDQIAESLGLKLEEISPVIRARRLCERLKKEKNVLIILDDLWKKLDLEEVGIPFGSQQKGCKILLTSRNQHVLCNEMDASKTFAVGDLDDKEAWEFFKKMAGDCVESADLRPTAIEVANKCARLPLAIVTVARALRNKSLFAWRDALRQLQRPYSENSSEISAEVYSAIELSINHLPSDDLKQTFLLCNLLRRNTRTEDLLRYSLGLGLIKGVKTLKEGRDRLLTMMSTLKESCMLLDCNTDDRFLDVHDLTYIVAKSIASEDNQVFSLNQEDVLTDWPDGESMKKCNKICLLSPSINKLPDQLNCPQLFLFLLFSNDLSLTLSADFFEEATNLKVLDLTYMQFSSLPSSICLLTSLSTLCLDQCKLGDNITIIGGLKSLEILSLWKSDIRILPREIEQLVKLKLLDVSWCAKLTTIADGVLSSLTRLEELYMGGTSIQWGQSCTASLAELNTLSHLSTLQIQIPDAKAVPQDFFVDLQKLECYKIFIGKEWEGFGNNQYSRTINLRLSTNIDDLDRGFKRLLKKTEDLQLDELKGVKIALQDLTDEESLPHLKNLHIQNGLDTEYIINDEKEFPQLQSLTLQSLPHLISFFPQHKTGVTSSLSLFNEEVSLPCLEKLWLKSINVTRLWQNQLPSTSFCTYGKLTTLKIEGCGSLKQLFSFSMAKYVVHLTDFQIIGCHCLREIIFMEEETQGTMSSSLFPQLKSLELKDLQHLIGFCSDSRTQVIEFPAMKSLTIYNCPEMEGFICRSSMEGNRRMFSEVLFDNKVAFPSLEKMNISYLGKMKVIWEDPLPPNSFPKLREVGIMGFPNLKYIWKNDPKGIFSFKNLREISVGNCWSLKNVFPASIARDLPKLSDLRIVVCGVEEIVSKVEDESDSETTLTFEFDQLSSLMLWGIPECKCFYPGRHTTKWPMLKELHAYKCGEMKIFGAQLDSPPPLFLVEKVIPKLQRLAIGGDYTAMISGGQFSSSLFHEIKAFKVEGNSAISIQHFQISFLKRFNNLEELCISFCEIKELFCTEGDTGNMEVYAAVGALSTIKTIKLNGLHNLKYFLWKQDVQVDRILPNLETLEVANCDNLMSLGSSSASFQNLTTLKVRDCKGMKYLDTCLAVQNLAKLKKLIIRECISMMEIVASEEDEAMTSDIIFSRLKSLELVNLPRLKSFCSGNHTFGFPCLEELIVSGCPELEIFCKGVLNAPLLQSVECGEGKLHWSGDLDSTVQQLHSTKVGFQGIEYLVLSEYAKSIEIWKENIQASLDLKNITVVEVEDCNSLKYIFSVSMALDLLQLKDIKVKNCPLIEQIIKKGAEEITMDTVWLPKLERIRLESCSELTSFYMGSITLQCPSLKRIEVDDCPKMYAMASPREVGGGEKTPFFNDKVLSTNLQALELSSTDIQKLWPDKPHSAIPSNVHLLQILIVKGCHNLEYIFPSYLIKNFVGLAQLSIGDCENMEEVIFIDESAAAAEGITETYLFTKVEKLELSRLPKLGTFCHGDNSETESPPLFNEKVRFPSLNYLMIEGIGKCRKIWHDEASMGSFYELTFLGVKNCEYVERIIGPDDDHACNSKESHEATSTESIELKSTIKFVFPKIRELNLQMLPKLKCFYSKVNTTEWPSLKQLEVIDCGMVETFAREYVNFGETQGDSQPLFWVTEETFPTLEELLLIQNANMKEIWHAALPNKYFFNLRRLGLIGFLDASVTILNCFVPSLPNLEELFVGKAALKELFPCEGLRDEEKHAGTLAHLKELMLMELPKLTHLWKKQVSFAEVLYNLEILRVMDCGILKNLVPTSVSFKHLTTLKVSKCHGLRNLVTFTIAKSMVQLKTMSVTDCQMIEEIIASTTDEVMDAIVFNQLKYLELDSLPCLSRFCSGIYTLVFPKLEDVIIGQCPKMKFFTMGEFSTPMLYGLQSTNGEEIELWEGDLNATIQQLFIEKVFPSLEDLELSSINIQRAWNHKLLATYSYAWNLTCLTIEGCHNLNCLFSSSMVKSFVQLKKLNIENCENAKNVIFVEGSAEEEMMNRKLFRVLEFLVLKDLPKLTTFCHGNYFEFPLLTSLRIESCPTLKTFISGAQGIDSEMASPTLFDGKVAFTCLEELTIIGVGNWRKIWEKKPTNCVRIHFRNY
ncbi:hypothetical protein HRI_001597200 [Hibiscus trionum]|uniref:AAA+ ATPase domain-containing protein n=1 Tax=Hibiscus trionum TaxID=183268 RepID=A0A9W7LW30_HIBTR|nr:hypothetical protein HRI_001597200 [Hibiscus trionum]